MKSCGKGHIGNMKISDKGHIGNMKSCNGGDVCQENMISNGNGKLSLSMGSGTYENLGVIEIKGNNLMSGKTLVDTGSQVSLVRLGSIRNKEGIKPADIILHGVTGTTLSVEGKIEMLVCHSTFKCIHEFYVVNILPQELDLILGQDFLSKNNVQLNFDEDKMKIIIPPRTEKIIKLPLNEKGDILVSKQEVEPGVYIGDVLTTVKENKILVCIMNTTDKEVELGSVEINYERPPKQYVCALATHKNPTRNELRHQLLDAQLRLDHVTEGKESLRSLCHEYVDVFHLPGDRLTETKGAVHTIPTPDISHERAIHVKSYRIPQAHYEEVDKQIQQMLEDGIVVPSSSPWNFPILVVPKKIDASGKRKFRICVDFRKLNDVTIGDSYPLPNIQDILDKLGRSRYFSALDCASGYHQIPIAENDRKKTAFSTSSGHFEYTRMPFGLKSAPATFQRLMNNVLSGLLGLKALVYLDDILIFGETMSEHNAKLREVLERIREYNVKLQPDKCEFMKTELAYLGHIVTPDGVKPDPSKTEAVVRFPAPTTPTEIKSFLGLAGYYRRFIPNFSLIAKPLTELSKKDVAFKWIEKEEEAFQTLKFHLINPPLLQYPYFTKPFILTTDASQHAIGCILSQGKVGQDLPISYASRTLNSAERNYSVVEKELLAIVWGCKHFRPYLLGHQFTIVTDHKPLTWIFSVKDPSSRLLRWRLLLEEYQYDVQYKAGVRNTNADALSRDPNLCLLISEEDPTEDRKQRIIREMHQCPIGGHQGIHRTLERIKLYITWPNMKQEIETFIRNCDTCQRNKATRPLTRQELEITDTQSEPWIKIALDVVGPLPITENNNKYLLTCQDNLTKYLIAIPIENQEASTIAEAFVTKICLVHGIPQIVLTDQGANFVSQLFKQVCKLFKVHKIETSAYHPESNGSLERSHKVLIEYLRCFCTTKQTEWEKWIPFATFVYNTTPHTSTKFTPFELMYGRLANLPGTLQKPPTSPLYNYDDFLLNTKHKLKVTHEMAKENLIKVKEEQKDRFDRTKANAIKFKQGMKVLLSNEATKLGVSKKLSPPWTGPYEIMKVNDNGTLALKSIIVKEHGKIKSKIKHKNKMQTVHANRVKPYFCNSLQDEDTEYQ